VEDFVEGSNGLGEGGGLLEVLGLGGGGGGGAGGGVVAEGVEEGLQVAGGELEGSFCAVAGAGFGHWWVGLDGGCRGGRRGRSIQRWACGVIRSP